MQIIVRLRKPSSDLPLEPSVISDINHNHVLYFYRNEKYVKIINTDRLKETKNNNANVKCPVLKVETISRD